MSEPLFYREQLTDNFWGLEGLIQNTEALAEIGALAKSENFCQKAASDSPYFNGWNVVWITFTQPFYAILSVFTSTIALALNTLLIPRVGRVFTVLSKQLTRDWSHVCAQWEFKAPLLTPSTNAHQLSSWDIFNHGDLPYASVHDEMVRPLTLQDAVKRECVKGALDAFYGELEASRRSRGWSTWIRNWGSYRVSDSQQLKMLNQVFSDLRTDKAEAITTLSRKYFRDNLERPLQEFYAKLCELDEELKEIPSIPLYSEKDLSKGGSLWFIYLVLNTGGYFRDLKTHLEAVAQQFVSGMPRQAALLQGLHETEDLLKLQHQYVPSKTISLHELDKCSPTALKKIQQLGDGLYRVEIRGRHLVLCKNQERYFAWDPNFGLYQMTPEEVLTLIRKHHQHQDPDSVVHFHRYSLGRE